MPCCGIFVVIVIVYSEYFFLFILCILHTIRFTYHSVALRAHLVYLVDLVIERFGSHHVIECKYTFSMMLIISSFTHLKFTFLRSSSSSSSHDRLRHSVLLSLFSFIGTFNIVAWTGLGQHKDVRLIVRNGFYFEILKFLFKYCNYFIDKLYFDNKSIQRSFKFKNLIFSDTKSVYSKIQHI